MPAKSKSASSAQSSATIGLEATALRGSANLQSAAILRSLSLAKDNLWLTADSRSEAETAEGNRSNNMEAADCSGARQPERSVDSPALFKVYLGHDKNYWSLRKELFVRVRNPLAHNRGQILA